MERAWPDGAEGSGGLVCVSGAIESEAGVSV